MPRGRLVCCFLTLALSACDTKLTVQATSPRAIIDSGPMARETSSTATFTFHGTGEAASFRCRVDGSAPAACTSPFVQGGLANGPHRFVVSAVNALGIAEPSPPSREWTVDVAGPDTFLDSGPATLTSATTAVFAFHASDPGARFRCALDGAAASPCASPKSYTGLAEGAHRFVVTAEDALGNADASPTSQAWTIDRTAPGVALDSAPPVLTADPAAKFVFHSDDASATFECAVDGAPPAPCASPLEVTGLSDGPHRLVITAIDPAGNAAAAPATFAWSVDTRVPDTVLDVGPPVLTSDTSASLFFHATVEECTFECALDGAPAAPCTSPWSFSSLAPGPHRVAITARSAVGTRDPSPATREWSVSVTLPDTAITAGPAALLNASHALLAFSATKAGATFRCSLDGAAATPCASPFELTGLAQGFHWFTVAAVDTQGGVDPTPATWYFTVDSLPPETLLVAAPDAVTPSTSALFSFVATEGSAAFRCSLDGAAAQPCSPPVTLSGLTVGPHTFSVAAIDTAGNADPTPASHSWNVAVTTLSVTAVLQGGPPALSRESQAVFWFTASQPGSSFTCQVDDGAPAPCSSPATFSGLGDGPHTFALSARLPSGSTSALTTFGWRIDTSPPTTSLTGKPADPSASRTPAFTFGSSEAGGTFRCRVDSASFVPCTSPFVTSSLADGSHTFTVVASDAAGNADPAPPSYTWRVDATPPETSFTTTPPSLSYEGVATFVLESTEAGSSFRCSLDGEPFYTCTPSVTLQGLSAGNHTFLAVAQDKAGNSDSTPATWTWRVHFPWQLLGSAPDGQFGGWTWTAALDGQLYLGSPSNSSTPQLFKAYDPSTNTFENRTPTGELCACGYMGTLTPAAGKLFYFANGAAAYDPTTNAWTRPSYPSSNGEAGTAALGDVLYFIGGRSDGRAVRSYDAQTDAWSRLTDYPFAAQGPVVIAAQGKLYGIGGTQVNTPISKMAVFTPATGTWTELPNAPFTAYQSWSGGKGAELGGKLYVMGGTYDRVTETSTNGVYIYDPAAETWTSTPIPFPDDGSGQGSANINLVVADGVLYGVGDYFDGANTVATVWRFVEP